MMLVIDYAYDHEQEHEYAGPTHPSRP
jgi:hypothetical protein